MSADRLIHPIAATILWRWLHARGYDACCLYDLGEGWRLQGTAVFSLGGCPCHLAYEVDCDIAWQTHAARVSGWIARDLVDLAIVAMPGGHWCLNGIEQEHVASCPDVDLGFTPATNLIPLRRLALDIGHEADAPAAWLSFPDMHLDRVDQHYRRIGPYSYDYCAPDVGYSGILEVAEIGFVTRYPDLWEIEAMTTG